MIFHRSCLTDWAQIIRAALANKCSRTVRTPLSLHLGEHIFLVWLGRKDPKQLKLSSYLWDSTYWRPELGRIVKDLFSMFLVYIALCF